MIHDKYELLNVLNDFQVETLSHHTYTKPHYTTPYRIRQQYTKRSFHVIEYRIAFFQCELEIRFHLCELNRTQRGKYGIYHFTLPTDSYYHIVFFFTLPNANKM